VGLVDPEVSVNGFQQPSGIGGPSGTVTKVVSEGKETYEWRVPQVIGSQGAPLTVKVKVTTTTGNLNAVISLMFWTLPAGQETQSADVGAGVSCSGTDEASGTYTVVPGSPDKHYIDYVIRVTGGFDVVFRYNVER
jgi:hypothetical protein